MATDIVTETFVHLLLETLQNLSHLTAELPEFQYL